MLKNPPEGYHPLARAGIPVLRRPNGGVLDRQGNQWWISTHIEDGSEEEIRRRMAETSG